MILIWHNFSATDQLQNLAVKALVGFQAYLASSVEDRLSIGGTAAVKQARDGHARSDYMVEVATLGDPANGCGKKFIVEYLCTTLRETKTEFLPAEAMEKR
jgi:hypothetical protein